MLTLLTLIILRAYVQEPIVKKYTTTTLLAVFVSHAVEFAHSFNTIRSNYPCSSGSRKFTLEGVSREETSRRAKPLP